MRDLIGKTIHVMDIRFEEFRLRDYLYVNAPKALEYIRAFEELNDLNGELGIKVEE